MSGKGDYIQRLEKAIYDLHGLHAIHLGTECVSETLHGKVVWRGEVEVFTVTGHPQARMCYAWSYQDGRIEKLAVVLGIPPIRTEFDAVRSHIASEVSKQKRN